MTPFPPHPAAQKSIASNSNRSSGAQSARGPQSAWGLPAPGTSARRGLTPLSTNLPTLDSSGRPNNTSPSPFTSSFSSVLNSSSHSENTRILYNSAASPFPPLQSGSQQIQPSQLLLSPRSRAITPSSHSYSASSAAASTTASQGGGGGGGGGGGSSRSQTFSPPLPQNSLTSPTINTFDRSPFSGSTTSSATSGQSSVSKIVVTQVFLLLGSITEKEGKAKWDSQAEAIRKLVESHGMEVQSKYFRRLLVGNSPQIFPGINRNVENPGNYPLLVQEMEKIKTDSGQASMIAEVIDTSEGDIFRDFDLSTFMEHFKLDAFAKTLLASALIHVSKPDLKTKAGNTLVSTRDTLISSLANVHNEDIEISPSLLGLCALRFLGNLPEASRTDRDINQLAYALRFRHSKRNVAIPPEVQSVLDIFDLLETNIPIIKELQLRGPQITNSITAAKEFLARRVDESLDERQVAGALLFMVLSPDWQQYSPTILVQAIHEYIDRPFDWQLVVQELDFQAFDISSHQFLALLNALLPMAKENPQFDIQRLWGGQWRHAQTQLSFVRSFLSFPPSELDAQNIPGLRQSYDPRDSSDGPDGIAQYIDIALHDPMISLDAIKATADLLIRPLEPSSVSEESQIAEIIGTKQALFLCSCLGVPTPRSPGLMYIMKRLFALFLGSDRPESSYVLHTMWKQDKQWVAMRLIETHSNDPLELITVLDRAQEHEWLEDLYSLMNGFGLDLAALAHRKGYLDLDRWAEDKIAQDPNGLVDMMSRFLVLKAQDELRTARDEQPVPRTVSLAMKTVYGMLAILDQHMVDRSELKVLQRQCLQAYPRLVIYCEGIEENVDVDCKKSNRLPRAADQEMQDMYKRMYSTDLDVKEILEYLRDCKGSDDPAKVDLYACMIHGLFDEFSCFGEYPLAPLATTAVLFGGIISYGLISDLTLRVGQEMILDAVRDHPPEASMYKFGLQALLHVLERLREPEWSEYCSRLVQIPGLRSTDPYKRAVEVLSEQGPRSGGMDEQTNGSLDGMDLHNGDIDDFVTPDTTIHFKAVNAESASGYEEPDDETQEKVIFFFNNVSAQNLKSRLGQLQDALQDKYHQWFACFLVDERAKVEPNYQPLYLEILNLLGDKILWREVLRETYVSVRRTLNAEVTMQSAQERKTLKNLATWLGSLTIARDKPIKHKNIAFLDLLIEGLETQRLLLVIPFTCNVLMQGTRSTVFKPPNPWIVDILSHLLELYNRFQIKTNQKFDIEHLFRDFGVSVTSLEETHYIQERPLPDEDMSNTVLPDGLDSFDDLNLGNINRTVRNPRFDPEIIAASLPELETKLQFPPASGSAASQARLREVVQDAVKRAISEIISPVVERSVTIAAIATSSLIHKDFAREPDEAKVRSAAQQMVRKLSGSLALVTCKEPLKMSMNNYIRMAQAEIQEPVFAEGAILMCVNDNLDLACAIIESQAEERSVAEIEPQIENEIAKRRQHRAEQANEPYIDPAFSSWASYIPDPYKQMPGGLNQEQLNIYLDFARQSRGSTSHGQTSSVDSARQLPDVLQDAFASVTNVHTPAESVAMPHRPPPQQQQQIGRILPPPNSNSVPHAQVNGYSDLRLPQHGVDNLLETISRMIVENPDWSIDEVLREGEQALADVWENIHFSPSIAMDCAEKVCSTIHRPTMKPVEVELKVEILKELCQVYPNIGKEVAVWVQNLDYEKMLNTFVTVQLVKSHIMSLKHVDAVLTGLLYDGEEMAVDVMSGILDGLLLNDSPFAFRAEFANSLGALGHWLVESPDQARVQALLEKLKNWGVSDLDGRPDETGLMKERQLSYIFDEWKGLCNAYPGNPNENVFAAFILQLHHKQLVNSQEDLTSLFKICIDGATETFERLSLETDGTSKESLFKIDSLSRLVILLVRNQGESDSAVKLDKAQYMKSILSVITLIMNHKHVTLGERFNQRVFFRLLSSILCDWHDFGREGYGQDRDMLIVFADNFLDLAPRFFAGFTYSWLMLVSHRFFMPSMLRLANSEGWESFVRIMEAALSYICHFLKAATITPLAIDLYRGILRIILILHHDFPEFLAENHFRLCNAIPRHCTQLHNLVLSAYPSSFPELPNPFVTGLKVDRLEEMRKAPRMAGDYTEWLIRGNVKNIVDACLRTNDLSGDNINRLVSAVHVATDIDLDVNNSLLHALVLYLGESAISAAGQKGSQAFTAESPQALLMTKLAKAVDPETRYYLLSAIVHQLRYPNSHTHYFSYALLHLFGTDLADTQESDVRQQITRVLLERLHVIKPHPWGLVITMLELIKNTKYAFFQLPFIKASPNIRATCEDLLQTAQERERWGD